MNTMITDAAVEAACQSCIPQGGGSWRDLYSPDEQAEHIENMRQALAAALPHLHPQPAELSEVSGGSGELEVPLSTQLAQAKVKIASLELQLSLAATGKQQVGEVQGSREQFEAWAGQEWRGLDLDKSNGGPILVKGEYLDGFAESMWQAWQAAIAARQPVGDSARTEAYDAIDRFLRNNMDDAAYAGYSTYLETLWGGQPAQAVDLGHTRVIEMLLTVAETAYNLADNSSDMEDCENIDYEDFVALSDALDALDELPDDQPGYTMSEPAKARWALRALIENPAVRDA